MGNIEVMEHIFRWVEGVVRELDVQPPVLEVGARNVNGSVRELFPTPYTGIDIEDGASVDLVADVMTHDFDEKFNTIVCTETLEHLPAPWEAVERMAGWLNPGGHLIVTTPFMHPLHDFPGDYFRFTGEGLRVLFDRAGLTTILATQDEQATYETARLSEGDPTDLIYVGTGVMRTAYGVAQCSSRGGLCES